jgi:integrase
MNKADKEIVELKRQINELHRNYENVLYLIGKGSPKSQKLLLVAMDEYMAYLRNEGVPPHLVKDRSLNYIGIVGNALELLRTVIRLRHWSLVTFRVSDIDDVLVGWFYTELNKRPYKDRTFNHYRKSINSFEIWLLDKGYISRRYFTKIPRKQVISNPQAITKTEFENLLKIIKPKTGKWLNNVGAWRRHAQVYRPWFKAGFIITLELGLRRNELIAFKFSNVIEEKGKPAYIRIEDSKVNHQRRIADDNFKKYKALPISKNLMKILMECGYKNNKGKDIFVIAPKITDMIERHYHVAITLSKGFRYYYRKLNTGRQLTMNCLRIADATAKYNMTDGHAHWLTGHSSAYVAQNHYVDKVEIAKAATKKGYSVFS